MTVLFAFKFLVSKAIDELINPLKGAVLNEIFSKLAFISTGD
ncbi:MAG: hypothetical protein ACNI3H_04370 [Halarcobacter ebronensis]